MLVYKIGPITYGLNIDVQDCEFYDMERFQSFASFQEPTVNYDIYCGALPEVAIQRMVFDTETGWYLGTNKDQWIMCLRTRENNPSQIAMLSPDFTSGDIFISPVFPPSKYYFPLSFPMGVFLTINLLTRVNGLLLHACGIIKDGAGTVFAGVSGTGKSTMAGLWENRSGVQILNDDKVIVRKEADGFHLSGTPWYGQGGQSDPVCAPLEKIFLIHHAPQNQVKRLDLVDSIARLMITTYAPYWDKQGMEFTLGSVSDLCQNVSCFELGFKPDDEIVDFVTCQ